MKVVDQFSRLEPEYLIGELVSCSYNEFVKTKHPITGRPRNLKVTVTTYFKAIQSNNPTN